MAGWGRGEAGTSPAGEVFLRSISLVSTQKARLQLTPVSLGSFLSFLCLRSLVHLVFPFFFSFKLVKLEKHRDLELTHSNIFFYIFPELKK